MSLIEFESAREKEKKRQWEREARNAILEKAKSKYESEKLREEERKQRGEHTWMLPSVEARLDSSSSSKKKKKKDKKKKKKKTKKRKDSSSSSSSESEENEMWVEKPSASAADKPVESSAQLKQQEPSSKRDGWMEMTSLFKTYSRDEIKEMDGTSRKKEKEEEKRRKQEADKPGSHARELNPYYKNGGTGLPEENQKNEKSSPSPAIGLDAAWLRKALQRAKEQAQTENKTLEEVAAQRWGSLAKFNELLAEAEGRSSFRDRDPWHRKSGTSREDSHRRERNRSKSRERRSRSRERRDRERERRRRSRSRERVGSSSKSRRESRERERSRSIEKRDKERERKRSESREKVIGSSKSRRVSRDRSRERKRSRSVDRKQRSRDKKRSPSKDRESRDKGSHRRRYSNSGSSSDSESDSSNSSGSDSYSDDSKRPSSNSYKAHTSSEGSRRTVSGLMRPPGEARSFDAPRSSLLSAKFHKPGEDIGHRSSSGFSTRVSSSSNQSWRKKEYPAEEPRMQEKPRSSSSSSSSSESSDEESQPTELKPGKTEYPEKPPTEQKILTDKEMNELAAKIMKAELIGNDNLANKLKNKLETARSARARAPSDDRNTNEKGDSSREEVVLLMRTDAKGFSRPVTVTDSETGRKKQGKMKTHDKDGKRARYFPDDDKYDLKQMFEAEKGTTAEDQNSMFNRAAMQNNQKLDDEYDMDDMFMSKAVMKENSAKQAERDKKRAIQEHQRSQRSLESCQWCFENKEMAKHLIVALGTKAYVCLPPHESLTAGHCLIIPIHHVMCSVQADEDLWSEIMSFRKSLVRMFNSRDEDCIFFETAKRFRHYPHMVINCVPLPKETGDMAPIYFKKAIMECEAEWAQNKKLVDLKNRDVRRAVPKGLPYFFVDFAMDPGYAHVIEDEQDFPHNFAQEIVGGMLDLENNLWRKPRKENFDAQRRKVMEFSRWYKEYDITQDDKS